MRTKQSAAKPAVKPTREKNIPFVEKYMFTIEEACIYFHIGERKMYEVVRSHEGAKWMLHSGKRVMIKRELFSKWLDQQAAI